MDNDDIPTEGELVPLTDIVTKLRDSGLSPDTIAATLSIPAIRVRTMLVQSRPLSPDEQDIADKTRLLIRRGIIRANEILDRGTRQEQMQVVKATLNLAGKTLSKTDEGDVTEGRTLLLQLFEDLRVEGAKELPMVDVPEADD